MNLLNRYNEVNTILNTIDFDALYHGFHKYKFALYNSEEICFDGKMLPYKDDFRGNTAILFEGEFIAIWNMEFDSVDDAQILAYLLVHEMFHCHQYSNKESRFASDLALLNYPEDIDNFLKKYNENRYLAKAYETDDMVWLQKFAWIRAARQKVYPDMILQELRTETIEGMAEYVGLKALKIMNKEKFVAITKDYISKLYAEDNLFFDVRRTSYFSGAIYFLCLEKLGFSVNNRFDCEKSAYEQNPITIGNIIPQIDSYEFIAKNYAGLVKEKERMISEHMAEAKYVKCKASIYGYDPMNMFRVGNLVYCKYFVSLNENGAIKDINSAIVLKLAEGSNEVIEGLYYRDKIKRS